MHAELATLRSECHGTHQGFNGCRSGAGVTRDHSQPQPGIGLAGIDRDHASIGLFGLLQLPKFVRGARLHQQLLGRLRRAAHPPACSG
jgi:hypothetical protein